MASFNLWLESQIPLLLYHGSQPDKLQEIMRDGLVPNMPHIRRNFPDTPQGVYLTKDINSAKLWGIYKDSIGNHEGRIEAIVFEINSSVLDPKLISPDPHLIAGHSYIYNGTIPPSQFKVLRFKKDHLI